MKTLLILFKHTFNIVAFPFIHFGLSSRSDLSHIKKGCGPSGLLAKDTACAKSVYPTHNQTFPKSVTKLNYWCSEDFLNFSFDTNVKNLK